jgi:hypothetical protein
MRATLCNQEKTAMRVRVWAAGTALAVATVFGGGAAIATVGASSAAAAKPTTPPVQTQVPCTVGGVASTCTVRLTSLQAVNHTLQAAGTVTTADGTVLPFSGVPLDPPATCPILSLTLGPLNLNLLGLVVNIPNPIILNITAVPGPGNLLGNLLCSVTNLLNNTGSGAGLTALLNSLNALLAGL